MPLESIEPALEANWSSLNNKLCCPHCKTPVQINGFDYLDQEHPSECIW